MTVTYTSEVATSTFGCFIKLLIRWRGSIYKLLWKDFVVYILLHYLFRFVYRFALTDPGKRQFESVSKYCESYVPLIPLSFVLGFYVQQIVNRWQLQFGTVPFPDSTAVLVTANVKGLDERGRLIRRTMMRYLMLGYVMTMRSIAPLVKKRFPTMKHLTQSGLMLPQEEKILENVKVSFNKYSIPFIWATSLVSLARKEGRIFDDYAVAVLNDSFNTVRQRLNQLFLFDWVGIPLVYTQVVTLCVYMYFILTLFSHQFLLQKDGVVGKDVDLYVPVAAILQFLFFMGWLKVAETLINPFGEDDDDFDINSYIDRNMQLSYLVVDGMHADHPPLVKDMYWGAQQFELPYTQATLEQKKANTMAQEAELGSAAGITVPEEKSGFVTIEPIEEEAKRKQRKDDLKRQDSDRSIRIPSPSPSPIPSAHSGIPLRLLSATPDKTPSETKRLHAVASSEVSLAKKPSPMRTVSPVGSHRTISEGGGAASPEDDEEAKALKVIDLPMSANAVKRMRRKSYLQHIDKVRYGHETESLRSASDTYASTRTSPTRDKGGQRATDPTTNPQAKTEPAKK